MGARRRFSAAFKRQVVEELLAGAASMAQLCRRYELCQTVIRNWRQQYAQGYLSDPEQVCQGHRRSASRNWSGWGATHHGERPAKKGRGLHAPAEKRGFIAHHRAEFGSVRRGCELMGLARSSYYYRPRGASPEKRKADTDLRDRIEELALRFPRYGYRRMTAQFRREGFLVNHKRVLQLMRESDLLVKSKRKWVSTTDSRHGFRSGPTSTRRSRRPGSTRCGWPI